MRRPGRRALGLMASGATCVQKLDGSRDSAIHTKYRILLRSSSMREPRYPLPRVVLLYARFYRRLQTANGSKGANSLLNFLGAVCAGVRCLAGDAGSPPVRVNGLPSPERDQHRTVRDLTVRPKKRNGFAGRSAVQVSTMILPQVHLRKPCYDFSFL